jgi:hypothetical protein
MRSETAPKATENRPFPSRTPHNPELRIIGTVDIDPVAGCILIGTRGFRNDADAFGLHAQGHDLTLVFSARLS